MFISLHFLNKDYIIYLTDLYQIGQPGCRAGTFSRKQL